MIFTGSGNANKISGIPVASGTPTDTYTLIYDAANNKWVYATNGIPSGGAVGGASAVAANQILYGASSGVATSTSTFVNTSTGVGVGTAAPLNKFTVISNGTANTAGDTVDYGASIIANSTAFGAGGNAAILNVQSNSTLGADVGSSIGFGGRYTGTQFAQFAIIRGAKENATDGNGASYLAFGTRVNGGNIAERMRIDSTGNVGIGTASPAHKLDVLGSSAKIYAGGTSTDTTLHIGNADVALPGQGGFLVFHASAAAPYLSINALSQGVANRNIALAPSGGNVGIGLTNPAYKLEISTDSAAKPSTNTWTIASDSRLKTVKGEYSKGLAEICQVRPVRYEYNGKGGMVVDGKEQISIIAQELMEVFPECVSTFKGKLDATDTEETEMYNYNGHAITFALINAIKELKAEIDVLKAR